MHRAVSVATCVALLFVLSGPFVAGADDTRQPLAAQERETFRATAQALGTGPSGQTGVIITISRWSTDEERNALATVLAEEGSNALADALNKQDETGFIRFPQVQAQYPSVRLRYARQFPNGDGRTIILATDRALGWAEAIRRPQRTVDNRVTLIQLDVDAEGNGEGVMALGVELVIDAETNTLSISTVSSQPIRLVNVRH